ncbi:MAG: arylesterase [Desulfuromonas sp.]|nr:MAG: arylesterase [Desulfuromonas sp.]
MRRTFFVSCFVLVLIGLCAGCDSSPHITPLGPDALILSFGDSLTHGTGAAKGQSYPEVLGSLLGRKVINAGIPGEVSAAGRSRLPMELKKYNPALVILCHGGNDFLRRLDQKKTRDNIRAMVEMIRASGADVVLIGVPKLGWGLNVPSFYEEIAESNDIPYAKNVLVDLLGESTLKSDTIHPNTRGYHLLAEAVYDLIKKAQ